MLNEILATVRHIDGAALIALRIAIILMAAWIISAALHRLIRLFRERISSHFSDAEAVKRATTLDRVIRYLANVIMTLISVLLILSELGISVAPILGAAGVVGIAVGFGAQSLVKDYFTGFFLLLENQIRQGDVVEIAGMGGLVEEVTLRYVRLRDYEGNVHYIPNSLISTVTNRSRGFANAVIDIGVDYGEDIDEVFTVMRRVGAELRADPVFAPKMLDDLEIAGVESWADSAVMIRSRFKTVALEQWNVRREYLRRLKKAFDEAGIEIPFPQMKLHAATPVEISTATAAERNA
jgi:small conductance mechanosensitive channel